MEDASSAVLEQLEAGAEQVQEAVSEVAEAVSMGATTRGKGPGQRQDNTEPLQAYRRAREAIREFAGVPEWRDNPVVRELLDLALELATRVEADPTGEDFGWNVRETSDEIVEVIDALRREIEHRELDDPTAAAGFVIRELDALNQSEVAGLLAVDPRTVRAWKASLPKEIRKSPERVVLVAQIIYDLRNSMTPHGMILWFKRPRPQLKGRTPIQLLDRDPIRAADPLRDLARGARGQLAT